VAAGRRPRSTDVMPSMSASLIGAMRLSISFGNISTLIHNHHPRWVTIRWRLQHPVRRKLRDCRWNGSLNDCCRHSGPENRTQYRKFRLRSSGSGRLTRAGGSDRRGHRSRAGSCRCRKPMSLVLPCDAGCTGSTQSASTGSGAGRRWAQAADHRGTAVGHHRHGPLGTAREAGARRSREAAGCR